MLLNRLTLDMAEKQLTAQKPACAYDYRIMAKRIRAIVTSGKAAGLYNDKEVQAREHQAAEYERIADTLDAGIKVMD